MNRYQEYKIKKLLKTKIRVEKSKLTKILNKRPLFFADVEIKKWKIRTYENILKKIEAILLPKPTNAKK